MTGTGGQLGSGNATGSGQEVDPIALAAARDVLVQLDKAIRVFRMYDRGNDLVSKFLGELDKRVRGFMDKYGDLAVRVRPAAFEFRGAEITGTGLDEFALGLFRQGLTSMKLSKSVTIGDIQRFLEIVSEGLAGNESDEDDLVTMLWRAEIGGVHYSSVLGYVEFDAEDDLATPEAVSATIVEDMVSDLDELGGTAKEAFARRSALLQQEASELSPELQEFLQPLSEETSVHLQVHLLEIVGECLLSPTGAEHLSDQEVHSLLALIQRWLVEAGDIGNVNIFVGFLNYLVSPDSTPDFRFREVVRQFMAIGLSEDQATSLLRGLPNGPGAHLQVVATVMGALGRTHKGLIADLYDQATEDDGWTLIEDLLVSVAQHDPEFLIERFRKATGRGLSRTLRVLGRIGPDAARKAIRIRLDGADGQTQAALLKALSDNPGLYDQGLRQTLASMAAAGGRSRVAVVDVFCRAGDKEAAKILWSWAEDAAFDSWDRLDVMALLRGLMKLSGEARTLTFIDGVLGRSSLFRRKQLLATQSAVIDALTESASGEAVQLLKRHGTEGRKALRGPCNAALQKLAARARTAKP